MRHILDICSSTADKQDIYEWHMRLRHILLKDFLVETFSPNYRSLMELIERVTLP